MRVAFALILLPAAALAGPVVTADPSVYLRIEAGIICANHPARREPAPDTIAGFIDIVDGPITVALPAHRVPALPGLAFGVVGDVAPGGAALGVTVTVTHPPMQPDGITRESWQVDLLPGGPSANFFRFDRAEERVPGDWTLQAEIDGRVLYTARFEVVDPALMPMFVSPCEAPPQLS